MTCVPFAVAAGFLPREDSEPMRRRDEAGTPNCWALEAQQRTLTRDILSLICATTGRQRTADERSRLEALTREVDRVRQDRREAARQHA